MKVTLSANAISWCPQSPADAITPADVHRGTRGHRRPQRSLRASWLVAQQLCSVAAGGLLHSSVAETRHGRQSPKTVFLDVATLRFDAFCVGRVVWDETQKELLSLDAIVAGASAAAPAFFPTDPGVTLLRGERGKVLDQYPAPALSIISTLPPL